MDRETKPLYIYPKAQYKGINFLQYMSKHEARMISMKLLIDTANQRVLFAEGGKDCADFFFHILSLPLGSVAAFLTKESMVGSLGSLYESLESLKTDYIKDGLDKDCLLNPKPATGSLSLAPLLPVKPIALPCVLFPKKYYTCFTIDDVDGCKDEHNILHRYVSDAAGAICPICQLPLKTELEYLAQRSYFMDYMKKKAQSNVDGYVQGVVSYMIMDDLSIKPMSDISSIGLLHKFNVQNVANLEEREVTLDNNLAVALVKASLMSKTVLTDVFMAKKH